MRKKIVAFIFAAALLVAMAVPVLGGGGTALAGPEPTKGPGCFGQARAYNITTGNIPAGPGASGWGHMAASRAGDNGTLNQAWRDAECEAPPHGQNP